MEIIETAYEKFKHLGVAFSGGSDSLVVLDLVYNYDPRVKVLFVNTLNQFPETYDYIERIKRMYCLNLVEVKPPENRALEILEKGNYSPEAIFECCNYHKIQPFLKGIKQLGLDGIFVGIRRVEHEERAKETYFSPRKNPPHTRIHPILDWSRDDVLDYISFYNLPTNPLYDKGYTSLGCVHCTKPNPNPDVHERLGRDQRRERIQKVLREAGYT